MAVGDHGAIKDPDYLADMSSRDKEPCPNGTKHFENWSNFDMAAPRAKPPSSESKLYFFLTPSSFPIEHQGAVQGSDVWEGLKELTTAHGIPHFTNARGPIKRGFWGVMVTVTLILLIYNLTAITRFYFSYPVAVTIKLYHQNELQFPAVTICNMNPLRQSLLGNSSLAGQASKSGTAKKRKKRGVGVTTVVHGCEGSPPIAILCSGLGETITIHGGFYGRQQPDSEVCPFGSPHGDSTSCLDPDSQDQILGICEGMTSCSVPTSSAFYGGDPCGGTYKYVQVEYSCDSPSATTVDPTTAEPTTVHPSVVTSVNPTSVVTSELSTSVVTSELPTSVVTSDPPTSEVTSDIPTSIVTSERPTSVVRSDVPTSVVTSEPPTSVVTSEPPISVVTSDVSTSIVTSERPTSVVRSDVPTSVVTSELPTSVVTSELLAGVVTSETTTNVVTSETPTNVVTSELPTNVVTSGQTKEPTTFRPQTKSSTMSPTNRESAALTTHTGTPTAHTPATATSTVVYGTLNSLSPTIWGSTFDPTSALLTATPHPPSSAPADPTTEAPPPTNMTSQTPCCCTCCSSLAGFLGAACYTCGGHNISEAVDCAVNATNQAAAATTTTHTPAATTTTTPPTPTTTTTTTTTTSAAPSSSTASSPSTTTVPPTVPGSKFPERVQTREDFQEEEQLTETLAAMDETEKTKLGYTAAELILECQYSGFSCQPREFTQFYNPIHGNCYIFNSGWYNNTDRKIVKSRKAGRRHGLHLIVNISQKDYIQQAGDTAGIRLVVHPQTRIPFPEDEGITVSPGHATSIGIRQVMVRRQGKPYGACTDPAKDNVDIDMYEELYPVKYSSVGCHRTCYQRYLIDHCGCGDARYPMLGTALGRKAQPIQPCASTNITQDDCKYEVSELFIRNGIPCTSCLASCEDTSYSLEVSMGTWPSNVQRETILQKLAPYVVSSFDVNDPKEYKDNLIKLEIYYEEFNFEMITERPAYPPGKYLSDLGGVLGLWVGFSILTMVEFVEVTMDFSVLLWRRMRMRRKGRSPGSVASSENETTSSLQDLTNQSAESSFSPPPPYCK